MFLWGSQHCRVPSGRHVWLCLTSTFTLEQSLTLVDGVVGRFRELCRLMCENHSPSRLLRSASRCSGGFCAKPPLTEAWEPRGLLAALWNVL